MIRRAAAVDVDKVIKLLHEVLDIHYDIRPDLYNKNATKYSRDELLKMFECDRLPVFVYDDGGDIKGYAFCELKDCSGSTGLKPILSLYIDDLCVDRSCRGQRIGKALFEYVKEFAHSKGCYNITLCVWEGNDPARAFYDAMGMSVQKTVMETVLTQPEDNKERS